MSLQNSKISYKQALLQVEAYLAARVKASDLKYEVSECPYKLGCAEYLLAMVITGDMSVADLRKHIEGETQ